MHVEGRILNEPILGTETQVKLLNKFVTQHTNLLIYRSSTDEDLHLEFDIHQLLGRSKESRELILCAPLLVTSADAVGNSAQTLTKVTPSTAGRTTLCY